jgi:hypothetical protein
MTRKKQGERGHSTTSFQGSVCGPVHTGTGDIRVEHLSYGTEGDISSDLRAELTARIDATSYRTVNTIIGQLGTERAQELNRVIEALEEQRLSHQEMMNLLGKVRAAVLEAQRFNLLPGPEHDTARVVQMIDAPNLDVTHKLKLSIPVVPFLLDYEAEIGLSSGMDLEKAWNWLTDRLRHS